MVRQARVSAIPARELFDNNPLPMWVYDVETLAFLAVNDAAIRRYGYSRREFLAMTIREIRPPEEIPALLEKTALRVEGYDAAGTWKHRKKDGTIIEVEITTQTIRFAGRKAKLVLANDVTERKRLEQGLHAAAEDWRRTFDAMSDAMALIDPDGTILRCNKALTILARKDYPEIIGHPCWEVVHGTSDRIPGCPVQEMLTTLKRAEATVSSGSQIHKVVAEPLVDESGRLAGAVHIMSDITQQEQARRKLHDLVLQQQAILDNIPDIAWLKDSQGRFLAVNESFGRASGFAPADLVGKTDLDIWPRELALRYRADDAEVMRTRTRKVVEEPLADKEGKTTWIETIKTPIVDEGGRVVGTTGIARDITVRKQAETALQASENKFRTLFETANDAIYIVDMEGHYLDMNTVAHERLGYTREEMLSKSVAAVDTPEFALRAPERIEQIRKSGKGVFESAHVRKDGTVMPVEINAVVIDHEGRNVLFSIVRDITERKMAENEVRAASGLLEAISRTQSQVIVKATSAEVFGNLLASLLGLTLSQYGFIGEILSGAGDVPFLRTHAITDIAWNEETRALYDRQAPHFEFTNLKTLFGEVITTGKLVIANAPASDPRRGGLPPGHPALNSFLGLPIYHGGMLIGMVGIANRPGGYDETIVKYLQPLLYTCGSIIAAYRNEARRKQAEEEIVRSEERYRDLFENAGDAIFLLDSRQRYLDANKKAEELTGYPVEDLRTMSVYDMIPPSQLAASTAEFEKLETSGLYEKYEGRIRRKDGEYVDVEVSSSAIVKDGTFVGSRDIVRDITERVRSTEEKSRLEAQLRQAQKVEAIGRLAGGVAHDFNNLTAIVLGYGEMLLGELRPEDPGRKYVEQIVGAGRRSAALTRQLLAFSRKQTLQPEVLDVNALLRDFESMLGRLLGEDIELDFRLAADAVRIRADRGQIEQVVANLAVNARDAMPLGGRLTIETAAVEFDETHPPGHESVIPGRYVLFAMADTGCGMDEATMNRLFEPFFTTKPMGKGTGLGLATTYGIVKQSGGYIWASSETGKGSTFTICLPRTDEQPSPKAIEAGGELPRGRAETILLVEDEASLRELCETLLVRLGYTVVAARNGPEALLLAQERGLDPDLVVTDVIMPGMSGAEMANQLRKEQASLKVLYMSGYPDEAIAPHGVLEPGTPFIQKPFTERALAVKVREALEGGASTAARPVRPVRRVLMIDDDEQFLDLVGHFCRKRGYVFAGVDSAAAALTALAGQTFDVLLVDLNIPGTSGEDILRKIRAAGHAAPAIVLTGDVASADMDVLRPLGAVQALEKSSDGEPLLQAIEDACALETKRHSAAGRNDVS